MFAKYAVVLCSNIYSETFMKIYQNRKSNIIADLTTTEAFYEFILKERIIPNIISYDNLRRVAISEETLLKFLNFSEPVNKSGLVDIIRSSLSSRFTLKSFCKSSEKTPYVLFCQGHSFEYIQTNATNSGKKLKKILIKSWINSGYLPSKAEEYARETFINPLYKRTNLSPSIWEIRYWTERGYNQEQSEIKISNFQKENSKKGIEKYSDEERRLYNNCCIEYYIHKFDMSIDEATEALSKRQATFTLDRCISKYGYADGTKIWKERQVEWQNTINSKSQIDLECMNKRKGRTRDQLISERGIEDAERIIKSRISLCGGKASMESMNRMIRPLLERISHIDCEILYGEDGKQEYGIVTPDGKLRKYDLTILDKRIIVEYHGKKFHAAPILNEEDIIEFNKHSLFGLTYEKCLEKDNEKRDIALKNGFDFYEIWYYNTKDEISEIISEIVRLCESR